MTEYIFWILPRYSALVICCAPMLSRYSFGSWQSMKLTECSMHQLHRAVMASFEVFDSMLNWDSPQKIPPVTRPYSPPAI